MQSFLEDARDEPVRMASARLTAMQRIVDRLAAAITDSGDSVDATITAHLWGHVGCWLLAQRELGAFVGSTVVDPVLPLVPKSDSGFEGTLAKAGLRPDATRTCMAALASACSEQAAALGKQRQRLARGGSLWHSGVTIATEADGTTSTLSCGDVSIRLTAAQAAKLRKLHDEFSDAGGDALVAADGGADGADGTANDVFRGRVFNALAREQLLKSSPGKDGVSGVHLAVSRECCDAMARALGVLCSCTSSPSRTFFSSYCSPFADTDGAFGSCGPFSEFEPTAGGSFLVVPARTTTLLACAVRRAVELLGQYQHTPLSFVLIVPYTADAGSSLEWVAALTHCPYKTSEIDVPEAGLNDIGRRSDLEDAGFGGASVFVLQTAAGAARWPVDAVAEGALRAAVR